MPQSSQQKARVVFTLSLASRIITYHQSKLIIADWVGVVNDYRRGRAGAVSHTVLQSMWTWQIKRKKKKEVVWWWWLGGCGSAICYRLGNYRLSRRPKSQRLNKEMKRNLRKMDESPGKHPPFHSSCIADDNQCAPVLSLRALTRCASEKAWEGGVAERWGSGVDRKIERACVYVSVCNE